MRDRPVPPEAHLYASAFDAYLRAPVDDEAEQSAAEWMTLSLNLLARGRLTGEPVRAEALKADLRNLRLPAAV